MVGEKGFELVSWKIGLQESARTLAMATSLILRTSTGSVQVFANPFGKKTSNVAKTTASEHTLHIKRLILQLMTKQFYASISI